MLTALDVQFATQGVYQVLVADGQEDYWVILQFNEDEKLFDSLCPCEEHEEKQTCQHVHFAYQKIINSEKQPLHIRFKRSLWNQLCRMGAEKIGFDVDHLTKVNPHTFEAYGVTGKCLFALEVNKDSQKKLKELLFERVKETEETSLKFSKLAQEEIVLWREGRPSFDLRYELSFWSDLAKWLMFLQVEQKPYKIEFLYSKKLLPHGIVIDFDEIKVQFYLPTALLPSLISSLATVKSPLTVYSSSHFPIHKIEYLEEEKAFAIQREGSSLAAVEIDQEKLKGALKIDEWLYLPRVGFYSFQKDSLLSQNRIEKEDIEEFLNHHMTVIEQLLCNTKVEKEVYLPSYHLHFDTSANLYIEAYIKEIGDLQRPLSALFGSFAYIEGEGFFRIDELFNGSIKNIIQKEEISSFVSQNRVWLSARDGFHTHLTSVQVQLIYTLGQNSVLKFASESNTFGNLAESTDFGEWLFVPGEGFYAKHFNLVGGAIAPSSQVMPSDIPLFIHMHQEELEQVKGFFSPICPIVSIKVNIALTNLQAVIVTPSFDLLPEYLEADLRFFGDFVYVSEEGFSLIPSHLRLPERFRRQVNVSKEQMDFFISIELPQLRPFAHNIDPRLKEPTELVLTLNDLKKDEDGWWSLELFYETEEGALDCEAVWKGLHEGKRYLFTSLGLIDLLNPSFQWLKQVDSTKIDHRTKKIKLSSFEVLRLQCFNEIKDSLKQDQRRQWEALCNFEARERFDLTFLHSELRPYQDVGVKWLWFLYTERLAGLLCDDMGLGKTHQAMALIAAAYAKNQKGKFLVVCPTSVIFHWQEKLKRFLPNLKVYTLYGPTRNLDEYVRNYDILLTSYGILRIEQITLCHISFEIAVFDEVQIAKNHQSQTHKALLTIPARMKLGLTGTPIENRLRELKALFDLVLPAYMPSEEKYRELFVTPIEKEQDKRAKDLLHRFIKPFVLRRKKSEVLLELPEKVEESVLAEFTEDQRNLYSETLGQIKGTLEGDLKDPKKPLPFVSLFALLTKLKQICDHPAVFLKQPLEYKKMQSGKWNLFVELLEEARESEQKVVVFSHYLDMLKIMELHLQEKEVGYALVQGDTVNRKEELERFQENKECMVFLGSLQAVGLGVELTAASVVIHYDRWWNPARENQATDRVYRMGQKRGVQVFKLVTKDTIEESIAKMIERKAKLMEEIIGFDDENTLKQLTREEWLEILRLKQ